MKNSAREKAAYHTDMIESRIKELRTEILGITQREMGDMLGVTHTTISYWESHESKLKPRIPMLIHISITFGVSLDWLFGLSEDIMTKNEVIPSPKDIEGLFGWIDPSDESSYVRSNGKIVGIVDKASGKVTPGYFVDDMQQCFVINDE